MNKIMDNFKILRNIKWRKKNIYTYTKISMKFTNL